MLADTGGLEPGCDTQMCQFRCRAHYPQFHKRRNGCGDFVLAYAAGVAPTNVAGSETPGYGHVPAWWLVSAEHPREKPLGFYANSTPSHPSVCIVSIIRATYVSNVSLTDGSCTRLPPAKPPFNLEANSAQGADANSAVWSVVETCIAVVSACLPTLNPLFSKRVRARKNATSRERYETSTLKNSGGSSATKKSTLKSAWSRSDSRKTGDDEERGFSRLSDADIELDGLGRRG